MTRGRRVAVGIGAFALVLVLIALALWLARARLAEEVAQSYFRQHGIDADVHIGALGLAGVSGSFSLGPTDAPTLSARNIELRFDPLRWTPYVVEVRLDAPVLRAAIDDSGHVNLPGLQAWLDDLAKDKGQSDYVSDNLAVSLSGLRALLKTPGGALEIDGDVKLVKDAPQTATLSVKPAALSWRGHGAMVRSGSFIFNAATHQARAHLAADIDDAVLKARDVTADLDATGLDWAADHLRVASLKFNLAAADASAGGVKAQTLHLSASNASAAWANGKLDGKADVEAGASLTPDAALLPLARVKALDPALAAALARALSKLDVTAAAHVEKQGDVFSLALTSPLTARGANGTSLRVNTLALDGTAQALRGAAQGSVSGGGLPALTVNLPKLAWNGAQFATDATLKTTFDFAMLRGADITATGAVTWQAGRFAASLANCARVTLAALHPGDSDLVQGMNSTLCAVAGKPLFATDASGWHFDGIAKDVSAAVPLLQARLDGGAAALSFASDARGAPGGTVQVDAARFTDRAAAVRYNAMDASGNVTLASGAWQGTLAMRAAGSALGTVTVRHAMASGEGSAHIDAPHLSFASGKLQPVTLSPLLASFRNADGEADFSGDLSWHGSDLSSHGVLKIAGLDFLTPLGRAHAVKTELDFTSLLPPVTAPGQKLAIARIDWTLPFSSIATSFSFSPISIAVDSVSANFADGGAALDAFKLDPANPAAITGVAHLSSIALASLVTATNMGGKIRLDGKISGQLPFTATPEGIHIAKGHVVSDGPGHLSVDRSLWASEGAVSANAVQDFAYQAMEHLAYDQLSADLNSVAGGRLQILFHIKGHSDPPTKQTADIPVTDLINGTALQKPLPLPSGTPIDLTLDTSLNFDELLKSYSEAWSKTLSQPGAADTAHGATP
jgi:hypothetical protein